MLKYKKTRDTPQQTQEGENKGMQGSIKESKKGNFPPIDSVLSNVLLCHEMQCKMHNFNTFEYKYSVHSTVVTIMPQS